MTERIIVIINSIKYIKKKFNFKIILENYFLWFLLIGSVFLRLISDLKNIDGDIIYFCRKNKPALDMRPQNILSVKKNARYMFKIFIGGNQRKHYADKNKN